MSDVQRIYISDADNMLCARAGCTVFDPDYDEDRR